MKQRCFVLVLLGIHFFHITLLAQDSCTIQATFKSVEIHNKKPVADLLLYFIDAKINVQTDEFGLAQLSGLCPGWHRIHVHSLEIQDTTLSIYVKNSGVYELKLDHANHMLNLVEVKAMSSPQIIQSQEVLNRHQLEANAGKGLAEQLKSINGVTMLSNGATIAKPVIHGFQGNRILLLNNGVRQEDQQWGNEHAPNIDPFVAQQITVLKGAAGVRYGTDAIGGVVLVEPSSIRSELGTEAAVSLVGMSNNRMGVVAAKVEHRFEKIPSLAFRLQGSAKQGGNYRLPGRYYVANSGVQEGNFSAQLNYQKAHHGFDIYFSSFNTVLGIYRGAHTGSQMDLMNAINSDTPLVSAGFTYQIDRPRQVVTHNLLKAKAFWDKPIGLWNLTYAYQNNFRQEYDVQRVENGRAQLNLSLQTHSVNLNLDHKKIKNITGQWGLDAHYQHNTFRDGDRVFIPSYYAQSFALYAIERMKLRQWLFETGLRFDYKHFEMFNAEGVRLDIVRYVLEYNNPSATFAVKRNFGSRLTTSATLSQSWRAPQAAELFSAGFHQAGARIEYGNRNLKAENALGLNLNLDYRIEEKLNIAVSAYSQAVQNFIYLSPGAEQLTIRGYFQTFNYLQTNALISGLDVKMPYSWNKHWQIEVRASFTRARDTKSNDWIILMPSDRYAGSLSYKFKSIDKMPHCAVGVNGTYVPQQRRIPGNFDQIDFPRPPSSYFLLDAFCDADVLVRKQALKLGISVTNLLNTRYRDYLDLFRYFIDQPGTNVRLRVTVPLLFTKH